MKNTSVNHISCLETDKRVRYGTCLLIMLGTVMVLLPFVNKPFHMDDTLFLRKAEHICRNPLDPYNFDYNWYVGPLPMWKITKNPPLNAYILAGLRPIAGEREWIYHTVYMVMAALCAILTYFIAAQLTTFALPATVVALSTPVFLVSATTVMADIPLYVFWLTAIFLVIRSVEPGQSRLLWGVGLAAAAAAMTKYFGIAVAPLALVYWLAKTRRLSIHLFGLGVPLLVVMIWGFYTKANYGIFHPLDAAGYSVERANRSILQVANTLSFIGGALLWPIVITPLAFYAARLRNAWPIPILILITLILWFGCHQNIVEPVRYLWIIMTAGGVTLFLLTVRSMIARRDAESILLGSWFGGTAVFAMCFNWTIAARILLPAALPAGLLVFRWIETLDLNPRRVRVWTAVAAVPCIGITLLLARVDFEVASVNRTFAETTGRNLVRNHRVLFAGHWGFQYYMEREGAEAVDYKNGAMNVGDILVLPFNNSNVLYIEALGKPVYEASHRFKIPFHLMNTKVGSGFYSSTFGPVPFGISRQDALEIFTVYQYRLTPKDNY